MKAADYGRYVACFNACDYAGLHDFFADDVSLQVNGYEMRGKKGISDFYDFFHDHVRETVMLRRFIEGDGLDFAHVVIRFEGLRELTAQELAGRGYAKMTPVPAGVSVELDFFITYESRNGKVAAIRCAVFEPPAP
ncbi:MAG TPA: nuclear transport factor 2 family protein [Ramlibacter sp.]|nr:nuclear transport factor 2 family protein [Ramlibacter sp.]